METRGSKAGQDSQMEDRFSFAGNLAIHTTWGNELSKEHVSYWRLFLFLIVSIFLAEVAAMILVYLLPPLPYQYTTLIDAGTMVILIFPVLYYLSFRPLINHIEKKQQAERTLQRVNRALSVLNECNQALVRSDDETKLLQQMCEILVNIGEYRMAWVGFAEQNEKKSVLPIAQMGFEGGYLDSASISWADTERGHGPTGTAIREGIVQVNQNFLTNPRMAPWRELALQRGYQSSIALPLQDENSTFGALTIYSASPDAFDEHEKHLLQELASDLAFGIAALRVRAERQKADELNRQLSRIVEQTEDTVVVTNCDGVIEYVNLAFERITGYTKEEALGKTPRVIKSGTHDNQFYKNLWNTILKGDVFQSEMANCKKNGEIFYEVKTITPLRDVQGNITHFVATGKDITQHKLDEEKLLKAYDDLELRVQKRTEELKIANSELEAEINERKQAEEALQQSEAMLRAILDEMPSGVTVRDAETGKLILSNARSREILGTLVDTPEQFAHYHGVHPDGRLYESEEWPVYRSITTGEAVDSEEIACERSNGTRFTLMISSVPIRDPQGKIAIGVGVFHDITERRLMEEALRESEKRLGRAQEIAHLGSWELDLIENKLTWSDEVYRIFGLQPQEFGATYEAFLEAVHPDDRAAVNDAYSGSIRDGRDSYEIEHRVIRRPSGEIRVVHEKCEHFRDEAGGIIRSIGMVHDITERKRAEDALRAAHDELELRVQERTEELAAANEELRKEIEERTEIERQLRLRTTAMEAAADGILITDQHGNIQWTNPALAEISGYSVDDLIGCSTRIFNSNQHDRTYYHQLWNTILSGEVWRGELTNRRKDGSFYLEEQTITPVRGTDGEITQFIAIKQDITERKRVEQEIQERDRKEKSLTETIHTMQLDIARDLHDTIGQNISFLRMKLDYLAEKKIGKKADLQQELRNMARAANESYDLMRGTLAVLQSENSTDLFRLFSRYAEQIEERSSFKVDFSSQGEPRFMSAKRMRQLFYIFREILNNIEKHASASQVSLQMAWDQDCLKLVVTDNGCGFDLDKVQYGSHYGLRFMRERAELLNGCVSIRSTVGSGTNILLEVPYK